MDVPHPTPIGIRQLRDNMRSLVGRLQRGEHYLVLRNNRPVAALIPYEDLLALTDAARRLTAAEAALRSKGVEPAKLSTGELVRLGSRGEEQGGYGG